MTPIKKIHKPAVHKSAGGAHHMIKHPAVSDSVSDSRILYETLTPTVKAAPPLAPLSASASAPLPVSPATPPAAPVEKIAPTPAPWSQRVATPAPSAPHAVAPASILSSAPAAPAKPEEVLDTRQEFFKLMSEKIREENVGKGESAPEVNQEIKVKSVNLYRKIAIRFIVLALILVAVVGYFALTKLTIVISPNKEATPDTLTFDVYGSGDVQNPDKAVKGNIVRMDEQVAGTFPATGVITGKEQFVGQVKITNNSAKAQPLVATTRLLTADGKIFRIKNSVNVPAGGSVMVDVYPDKPGADMAISPTHFTIPGLWSGLQDKIFADSTVAFSNSVNTQKAIQQSDIDAASQTLSANLKAKVAQSLSGANSQFDQVFVDSNATSAQITLTGAKVGDVVPQFGAQLKNVVNVISFASANVLKIAKQKMAAGLASDKILTDVSLDTSDPANIYTLVNYDANTNVATLTVKINGQTAPNKTDFIDKSKLVNLNEGQLQSYLKGIPEINSFDLQFFPPFIKRAPSLVDRIKIEIK